MTEMQGPTEVPDSASVMAGKTEGWYDSPDDPNWRRWWDGEKWTEHAQIKDMPDASGVFRSLVESLEFDRSFTGALVFTLLIPLLGFVFCAQEFVNGNRTRGFVLLGVAVVGIVLYGSFLAVFYSAGD